jgi:uncharacterized protein with PQ loop repeat
MWQDLAITIVGIILNLAMLPQITRGFKLKRKMMASSTALITTIGVFIVGYVFFTLNLYFSALLQLVGGTFWAILFIQSRIYKN